MVKTCCNKERQHEQSVALAKLNGLTEKDTEQICSVFKLLADPTRMRIVLALMQGDMCVYHLTEVCGGTVSGISHQLRVLRDNKIVRALRLGKQIEYSIADGHVREIVKMSLEHLRCGV